MSDDSLRASGLDSSTRKDGRRSVPRPRGWTQMAARILARDGGLCQLRYPGCTQRATDVDHRIPASQGGGDDEANLQAACEHCHDRKTGREAAMAKPPRRRVPEAHPGAVR